MTEDANREVWRAPARRIGVFLGIATAGWATASVFDVHVTDSPDAYLRAVTVLLAIGLFAAVQDIDRTEARKHWRTVLLVVTVGVMLKAAIIAAIMYAAFRQTEFLILGVAVAQIDPLSFAAISRRTDMSPQARTILSAWASFDDPITVVITVFFSSWALSAAGDSGTVADVAGGLGEFGGTLLRNLLFVAGALLARWLIGIGEDGEDPHSRAGKARNAVHVALVVVAGAVAVSQFLLLGLALSALFLRPRMGSVIQRTAMGAFHLGTFALGLLLIGGVNPLAGILLGVAAYGAQYLVGSLAAIRRPRADRLDLALGQQSGITAVILALFLEQSFPGTVGIVAPAILTVNVIHLVANAVRTSRAGAPVPVRSPRPGPREPNGETKRDLPNTV
jgi:hypothetical protein